MSQHFSIEVKQLSFHFKGENGKFHTVLKNISFSLEKGKTLALIGRNGSGKTTLLKILAQILKPASGTAKINGNVAAIIDIDGFFDRDLSGRENVKLFLKINCWKFKEIEAIIEDIKELSGLESYFDNTFKTYSKGMQSRLILSTALHLKAQLFLIDEVFFAGDAVFIHQIELFKNKLSQSGVSFIIATHNPEEVKQFAVECIWLKDSEIKQKGDPELVLESYNKFITQELSRSKSKNYTKEIENLFSVKTENEFIREIKVVQPNKDKFSYSTGFSLQIEYEILQPEINILPGLHILDQSKRILCSSTAFNSSLKLYKTQNFRCLHFQFPKEILIMGHYFVELIFSKVSYPDLPHQEEVFKYPTLIPLKIHSDESLIYGEDEPSLPLNFRAIWENMEGL
jgi:ABC-type polysaccharide/polyol phosphate transport system ATPase subunit